MLALKFSGPSARFSRNVNDAGPTARFQPKLSPRNSAARNTTNTMLVRSDSNVLLVRSRPEDLSFLWRPFFRTSNGGFSLRGHNSLAATAFYEHYVGLHSFAFIDCDLAISSTTVFDFIKDKLVNGSVIMIDDFFNIDENGKSIKEEFIKRFELNKNVFLFSTYGLGGVVYKYYKI